MKAKTSVRRRVGVAAAVVVLGGLMVSVNLGEIAVLSDRPTMATIMPFASARPLMMLTMQQAQARAGHGRVAYIATRAAALSPLAEPAFTGVAFSMLQRANATPQTRALLDQAHRLSRRDPFLLTLLVAQAHLDGDGAAETTAFDQIARLQVNPPGLDQILVQDLSRPAVRTAMAGALARGPYWRARFLGLAAGDPSARPSMTALVEGLRHSAAPLGRDEMVQVVSALLTGPQADPLLAWRLWWGSGVATPGLGWPAPTTSAATLPFDWSPSDAAHFEGKGSDLTLIFDTQGAAGPIATRRAVLAPGRYRLVMASDTPGVTLAITCQAQQQWVGNGAIVTIPADCQLATLQLQAPASAGLVRSIALQPQP